MTDDEDPILSNISGKERLDAILESEHLTSSQMAAALEAQRDRNQATFPHVVVVSTLTQSWEAARSGSGEQFWMKFYVGPFVDRAAAERWVAGRPTDNERVAYLVARMDTPKMVEEDDQRMRRALEEG